MLSSSYIHLLNIRLFIFLINLLLRSLSLKLKVLFFCVHNVQKAWKFKLFDIDNFRFTFVYSVPVHACFNCSVAVIFQVTLQKILYGQYTSYIQKQSVFQSVNEFCNLFQSQVRIRFQKIGRTLHKLSTNTRGIISTSITSLLCMFVLLSRL